MNILFLDKDLQLVGRTTIAYTNLQWIRRYYEPGQFTISLPVSQFLYDAEYVYNQDRPEIGVIQKVVESVSGTSKELLISGFFYEFILNNKITYPTYYASGELVSAIETAFTTYKEELPIDLVQDKNTSNEVTWQSTGDELATKFYSLLKTIYKSFKIVYNYTNSRLTFSIYEGRDKTVQDGVNYVAFSMEFKSISSFNADTDNSNYKNYFVIGGSGEGSERIYETLDLSNGEPLKKKFINASSLQYDPTEQTLAQYKESLLQYGAEQALNYSIIRDINIVPNKRPFEYLSHYDLGDLVEVQLTDIGLTMTGRIIEVSEVVKNKKHQYTLEIGEKQLTTLTKARMSK